MAVTDAELRDSDAAIIRLESLTKKAIRFRTEVYVHLAYAHIKKYSDSDFYAAESLLDQAVQSCRQEGQAEFLPLVQSFRIFLYAVMAGRLESGDRAHYCEEAIRLGSAFLAKAKRTRHASEFQKTPLFEVHNGLGIAYMRKGEALLPFSDEQQKAWTQSQLHYDLALQVRPNSVRALQNLGRLRMIQADQFRVCNDQSKASDSYEESKKLFLKSLQINPFDQYPHYCMAILSIRTGDWKSASEYLASGRAQKGAVKPESWSLVMQAIQAQNASLLDTRELF